MGVLVYIYILCTKWPFFKMAVFSGVVHFSRLTAGLFSHSRLRGTQGGRVYTTARMRAPAEVRGARPGPSKPRIMSRTMAKNYGESFRPAIEPSRTMETPQFKRFLPAAGCCSIMSDHTFPPALLKRGSHGRAAVVHQAPPFVAATDNAFSCVCVCGP